MNVTPKFSISDIQKQLAQKKELFVKQIIRRFQFIGEGFIAEARSSPSKWLYIEAGVAPAGEKLFYRNGKRYTRTPGGGESFSDWTGNLRSSIGYVILVDGVQLESSFPGNAAEGKAKGEKVVEEVSRKYPKGIVLICVAGMEYALYVEAMGYDVLSASSITAENSLKKAIDQISKKLR